MQDLHNRRTFLRAAAAAGVAWATNDFVGVDEALAYAVQHNSAVSHAATVTLSQSQADVVAAAAERILPAVDGRPGARDAGVVYFVDKALSTFNAGQKKQYVDGIADLNQRAARTKAGAGFAALDAAQQDEILRAVEQ